MKKFKKGELEIVDYILNSVFNMVDGDWGSYKVGDIIPYLDEELEYHAQSCPGCIEMKLL